jgi:hypothetical protein
VDGLAKGKGDANVDAEVDVDVEFAVVAKDEADADAGVPEALAAEVMAGLAPPVIPSSSPAAG